MPINHILAAVVAGVASAIVFLSALFTSLPALLLGYFTPLPLMLAGLGLGTLGAGIAGATATALVGMAGSLSSAVPFLVLFAVPVLVLARQALLRRTGSDGSIEWYPVGYLGACLAILAIALFGGALVLMSAQGTGIEETLTGLVANVAEYVYAGQASPVEAGDVAGLALLIPGIAVSSWMVMAVVNAALAQLVLVRFKRHIRPTLAIAELTLPLWFHVGIGVAALAWWQGDGFVKALGVLLAFAFVTSFLFQGLAVVHGVVRSWLWRTPFLVAFYVMVVALNWLVVPLVLVGMAEPWLGLRARFGARPRGGSS